MSLSLTFVSRVYYSYIGYRNNFVIFLFVYCKYCKIKILDYQIALCFGRFTEGTGVWYTLNTKVGRPYGRFGRSGED
jgi:hypothetical protein